jgi:pimeloyl-ACP methyl ester carboxylesterase
MVTLRPTWRRIAAVIAIGIASLVATAWLRPLVLLSAVRQVKLWQLGVEHRHVRVGPHRIHYLTMGEGPPLVLVPGLAMRAEDWSPLLRELGAGHRVYALDLLGHGESDRPLDAEYSVREQTDVLRGFLDASGLRAPVVLGVSLGGWVALRLALEHPQRVGRLVLVSSAGLDFDTALEPGTFAPQTIAELRAMVEMQTNHAFTAPDFVARDVLRHLGESRWVVRRATESLLTRRDVLDGRLGAVRAPVLLVTGTADRIVPAEVSLRMQRELPHARLVLLRGCGHQAILECRAEAVPAIHRFLAETGAG